MTRYSSSHKAETRQRLIDAAGRRFKADGIDGSGIATLVADVDLTNGAFYGHFASKNDLIAHVVAAQLEEQTARLAALPVGPASVATFIREYLSPAHRDNVAGGCPSAALLDEIGRCDDEVRASYTDAIDRHIDAIARLLDSRDAQDARDRAATLYCLLVGAMQTARAVKDRELSDRILDSTQAQALAIATGVASVHPTTGKAPR